MSNIHQIHLQSKRQQSVLEAQRLEQACEWIARIDRELQTEEQQALQQWLAASAGGNFVDSRCWVTWELGNK